MSSSCYCSINFFCVFLFFFNDTATTEIYTLSLHDALPISGLDSKPAYSSDNGNHPRAQSSWLTGCRAKKTDGPDIHLGVSLDQIVAREYAKETQLGSLELTLDPSDLAGNCAYGFSCAYNNTIAWRTPTTPLPMENNPRSVFERLFGASGTTDSRV